jgi:NAD(P)-dependent dehydrogenase (short-subunit alcohol dehydrogenase family)
MDLADLIQTTTIGLYLVSQWAIPKLQALAKSSRSSKPSLIVTSGILHREPYPTFFSLSLVKTAQRNLVDTLHRVYSQDGIHIGLVLVGGIVSSDAKAVNPANVASVTWDFFHQEAHKDKLEIEIIES